MFAPIFLKADIKLILEDRTLTFRNQNISPFGVSGLPWGPLNPADAFGLKIDVELYLANATPAGPDAPATIPLRLKGMILREETAVDRHMAIRFDWNRGARDIFEKQLEQRGYYPTEYVRKYPRLPAQASIKSFPMRAQVTVERPKPSQSLFGTASFDVSNLSPSGLMLTTENTLATLITPGTRLRISLDPRGWFPLSVRITGQVCRITDDLHPISGNLMRHYGVKFVQIDPLQKKAFLDLMKDILIQFKQEMLLNPDQN